MTLSSAAFMRGVAIGVAVAAPVGPMSLLCMRRTLAHGARSGIGTGAGIACGDALYALVAALGLAGVMHFMVAYERPLHAAAGRFLLYLGWRAFFTPPGADPPVACSAGSLRSAWVSAFVLTLTNPPTIVSFVAIFTALAPAGFDATGATAMAGGVLIGSLVWWVIITTLVAQARKSLSDRARRWIDRIAGLALGAFGGAELRRAVPGIGP
jgi:threonine/homoserine/homoserine lactone efflux protein